MAGKETEQEATVADGDDEEVRSDVGDGFNSLYLCKFWVGKVCSQVIMTKGFILARGLW